MARGKEAAARKPIVTAEREISDLREQLFKEITRVIPEEERLLRHKDLAPQEAMDAMSAESYPLAIFNLSELIWSEPGAVFRKLRLLKDYLLPELAERFAHVETADLEFDIWMLNAVAPEKRLRILATLIQWEQLTGMNVRHTGVIGHRPTTSAVIEELSPSQGA